jgi:Schlafen group 3, DNA/RNA helicase domain
VNRAFYSDSVGNFLGKSHDEVLGALVRNSDFTVEETQRDAWLEEIAILHKALSAIHGTIYFEYSIPRMGRRIDVVLLTGPAVLVLEFKVGEKDFPRHALDQVTDYALDLKNFHEPSHKLPVAPILIATEARCPRPSPLETHHKDGLFLPVQTNAELLPEAIDAVLRRAAGVAVEPAEWEAGRYCPTPTIVEAALALYNGHSVAEISRSDASVTNLSLTSEFVSSVIEKSRTNSSKSICFVTGVPGAGKTLVGLNLATTHIDKTNELYSVFLSGNGPLVAILREALARDKIRQQRERGVKLTKGTALSEVKMLIQNVHNFRDESLKDRNRPPIEHVAIFDEAQRAWDRQQTSNFMRRRKHVPHFPHSEPEFLISCLDRHPDWAVVVCLVGGGQEINTGEAGIAEWIDALVRAFPDWRIYISPRLTDSEYGAGEALAKIRTRPKVSYRDDLHLGISIRSFRAESVSLLVKQILDLETEQARKTLAKVSAHYPILISRDLATAKRWLKDRARGTERYGIVASSRAERLKPDAINVRAPVDPIHWFLDGKEDVRSSYYLEDVATEFHVQGLELDWACITWDADFRYSNTGWEHWSFCGDRWNQIRKKERRNYLKNAYRVLLTRARQGMVIVIPPGEEGDPTRSPAFYDSTYDYLKGIGLPTL